MLYTVAREAIQGLQWPSKHANFTPFTFVAEDVALITAAIHVAHIIVRFAVSDCIFFCFSRL